MNSEEIKNMKVMKLKPGDILLVQVNQKFISRTGIESMYKNLSSIIPKELGVKILIHTSDFEFKVIQCEKDTINKSKKQS